MTERKTPRAFPPPFNGFAQLTGCDNLGNNAFPLAVNPDNVEAVAYFNSLSGEPGDVFQVHCVSGLSFFALNTSASTQPAGREKPNPFSAEASTGQSVEHLPPAGNLDTYERPAPGFRASPLLMPRSENDPEDRRQTRAADMLDDRNKP